MIPSSTEHAESPASDPALHDRSAQQAPESRVLLLALLVYGLLFALPLVGWLFFAAHQTSVLGYAYRYDFLSMFIGARAVVVGHGLHLYDLDLQRTLSAMAIAPFQRPWLLPFVYPAYDAVLLAPVGWLSYGTA